MKKYNVQYKVTTSNSFILSKSFILVDPKSILGIWCTRWKKFSLDGISQVIVSTHTLIHTHRTFGLASSHLSVFWGDERTPENPEELRQ